MSTNPETALRQLMAHPVVTRRLPGRPPLTYRERAELGDSAAALLEDGVAAIRALSEWGRAEDLIRDLGREAYAPAAPLLCRLWRECPVVPVRDAAGHALYSIGTPEAHAALQAAIERADHLSTFLAVKSIVVTNALGAYDRLATYLSDESVSSPGLAHLAARILGFFPREVPPGVEGESWVGCAQRLLRQDHRWIRRAVELRRDRGVGSSARGLLGVLSRDEVDAALRRWPDPPATEPARWGGPRDLHARYRAGDHEAVWAELRAGPLGDSAFREEAALVAEATMRIVRENVATVTERLRRAGYPFDDYLPAWSPPSPGVERHIARIEAAAGGPCPISLRAFWSVVGEVSWRHAEAEDPPAAPWGRFALAEADPLCISSAEGVWGQVEEWLEMRELEHPEVVGPLYVGLSADYLHKANISGGAEYSVCVSDAAVDPLFENEAHGLAFVDYLRLCFRRGGFSRANRVNLPVAAAAFIVQLASELSPF